MTSKKQKVFIEVRKDEAGNYITGFEEVYKNYSKSQMETIIKKKDGKLVIEAFKIERNDGSIIFEVPLPKPQ